MTKTTKPKEGDLRVWHIQNPPGKAKYHPVKDEDEAKALINALVAKDLKSKRVTGNAFGLEIYDDSTGELDWSEWYADTGEDIMELIDADDEAKPKSMNASAFILALKNGDLFFQEGEWGSIEVVDEDETVWDRFAESDLHELIKWNLIERAEKSPRMTFQPLDEE